MQISFIQPSRDNLTYLKWSYDSIRKNQGGHSVEICVLDDASADGTWEWCQETMKTDSWFKALRNDTGKRWGHTIGYDYLIKHLATCEIACIFHADMYLAPGALDAVEKLMYKKERGKTFVTKSLVDEGFIPDPWFLYEPIKKRIISLTRIEPPLHPPGPEKIIRDFGTEPESFNEAKLLEFHYANWHPHGPGDTYGAEYLQVELPEFLVTEGVFAPWAFWVDEFKAIGGHDPLFAPQSKEDSDIFNRFALNGTEFIQTWEGFVYHMTCRGSRFNPNETQVGVNNPVWEKQNLKSSREFIRKWGHFVKHDKYLKPIIPPKFNIGFIVKNCTPRLLEVLEPWCSVIYTDLNKHEIDQYIRNEDTSFQLERKIFPYFSIPDDNFPADIIVEIDGYKFVQEDYDVIQNLSEIIQLTSDTGDYEINNLKVTIADAREYQNDLIICSRKKDYFK